MVIDGGNLYIEQGATVTVEGDFATEKPSAAVPLLSNEGVLEVQGDVTFHTNSQINGTGWLNLNGTTRQTVTSNGNSILNLGVDNSAGVEPADLLTVTGTLDLVQGNVVLGSENMTLGQTGSTPGAVAGGSASSYVETNGSGEFTRYVASGQTLFPVGNSSYNPLAVMNSGAADDFSVRVEDDVYEDYSPQSSQQSTNAVDRAWWIDEATPGGSDANVFLGWSASEEMSGFTHSSAGLGYYDFQQSAWVPDSSAQTVNSSGGYYSISRDDLSTFGTYFSVGSQNSPVPVEWLSFEAERLDRETVRLTWETASERNNRGFGILRKLSNEEEFSEIDFVEGQGTTHEVTTYSYLDSNAHAFISYYQLVQKDRNGKEDPSAIRVVQGMGEDDPFQVSIYPNPTDEYLFVEIPQDQQLELRLLTAGGKEVLRRNAVSGLRKLPVQRLSKGVYFLQLMNEKEFLEVTKVVVD